MRITKKIYFTAFDSRYELSFLSTFQKILGQSLVLPLIKVIAPIPIV